MKLTGFAFRAVGNSKNGSMNTETVMRFTLDEEAHAHFRPNSDGQMSMYLEWQWLTGDLSTGQSEWVLIGG